MGVWHSCVVFDEQEKSLAVLRHSHRALNVVDMFVMEPIVCGIFVEAVNVMYAILEGSSAKSRAHLYRLFRVGYTAFNLPACANLIGYIHNAAHI